MPVVCVAPVELDGVLLPERQRLGDPLKLCGIEETVGLAVKYG